MSSSVGLPEQWPHIISGTGVLLGLILLGEGVVVVSTPGPAYRGFLGGIVSSAPFIGGLIYGGYWLAESDISSRHYQRVGRWWSVGLLSTILIIGALTASMRPLTVRLAVGTVRWSAALGGGGGFIMGVLQAQAIQQAVEADRARRRQQETERERDRLDEFASIVSHDLRSPLNVAQGHLELLREDCESPHLDDVSAALTRMESIIEDTLTLARAGQTVGETAPVDLSDLATGCWQTVKTADATLDIEATMTVVGDEDRLRHLFENLFRNAIDHGGDDVTIRVGVLDDDTGFYVEDDGPGIPESDHDRVFESGYSGSSEGTGFGLSIVKTVADAHGWDITVTDSADGGARFEVTGVEPDE